MAIVNVNFNKCSQNLIEQYNSLVGNSKVFGHKLFVDFAGLLHWLSADVEDFEKRSKEMEFILVSLRAELLYDLHDALFRELLKKEVKESRSWFDTLEFILLTAAGILVAACEGFDGIATMLSIFSLPAVVILGAGFIFSLFSVVVFCGFDLVKVSHELGVQLSHAYKLLDAYLLQLQAIKFLEKKISASNLLLLDVDTLKQLQLTVNMLQKRLDWLFVASEQFAEALDSEGMQAVKTFVSILAGLLFFSGGFFAGQSVAVIIANLFTASVSLSFWPVMLFSGLVGLAAFSTYCFVEQPGLKKLVSSWFGLNEECVEKLCNNKNHMKQKMKLARLKEQISSVLEYKSVSAAVPYSFFKAESVMQRNPERVVPELLQSQPVFLA